MMKTAASPKAVRLQIVTPNALSNDAKARAQIFDGRRRIGWIGLLIVPP